MAVPPVILPADLHEAPAGRYAMIVADPPWSFKTRSAKGLGKSAQAHYECMSLDAIKALPVRRLAARHAFLWLWATNPMLPQALDVMASWGFTFKTAGHWSKRTKHGRQAFGGGYILRCAGEPFLIGTVGAPRTASRSVRGLIEGPIREHSRKPDQAFAAAELLIEGPRVELFSRQDRPGWDRWGLETDRFPPEPPQTPQPVAS